MSERRVSGWFVLSAVFIVLVFGLFFTFTERKSWPEHRTELGPMDMRLVPPVSTLWCEAVALHSDHSFVAYQVNHETRISSNRLSSQEVNMQMKLGGSWNTNSLKLKYFLLPSSVMEIVACSSYPGVKLMVFKGDLDVQNCLQSLINYDDDSKSSVFYSEEDSSEEEKVSYPSSYSLVEVLAYKRFCSSLLLDHSVDTTYMDDYSMYCNSATEIHPMKLNITSADFYAIVVWNTNQQVTNHVNLQVLLDRTRYTVHSSGHSFDLCSLSTSCVIGLGFASADRVLVSIPEEPNAGRSSFVVRSRCKPRLAVFAVLSVFLPLLLFLVVAFVVRADRDAVGRLCRKSRNRNRRESNRHRIIAPLLDDRNASSCDTLPVVSSRTEIAAVQTDEMPPPYHTLYDPPPPYACVKEDDLKNSRAS